MKTLSDHILDILQNSIAAKATLIEIMVEENKKKDICSIKINDNGCGMDSTTIKLATNPFFTSRKTRKVGLGLSLFKQNAEAAGGTFSIKSKPGEGTCVEAMFQLGHMDKPPLGDIWETFYLSMLGNQDIELVYSHKTDFGNFSFSSKDIQNMLGDVSLQNAEIKEAINGLIKNNLEDIKSYK